MYWLKQIGFNDVTWYDGRIFDDEQMRVDFGKKRRPAGISINDTLIVYGVGIKKILFVASVGSAPYAADPSETAAQPWRKRWYWSLDTTNLSQAFGVNWAHRNLDPYELVIDFHRLHRNGAITPSGNKTLSGLRYGPGYIRLSDEFGHYLVQRVMQLNH